MSDKDKIDRPEPDGVLRDYLNIRQVEDLENAVRGVQAIAHIVYAYYSALKERGFSDSAALELAKVYQEIALTGFRR